MHIVRRTGLPAARHLFFGHKWFVRDFNRGIAWGVLTTPNIKDLLCVVRAQDVEKEIQHLRYLISATGEGSARVRQNPEDPLLLQGLIFRYRNHDICVWFLANNGHDPLDLMIFGSHCADKQDLDETPKPPNRRYPFFDCDVWDDSAGGEASVGAIVEEESVDDKE